MIQQQQGIIFYSETRHYYQYFSKLIEDLLAKNISICYITSDKIDPLLAKAGEGMKVVYVKWLLGFLFSKIRADVMIMTMPDLGNFLFKRSAGVGNYIYMFHAAVSTHQQYRKHAFDNYDSIFCTGEYQEKEIRLAEARYQQKPKDIVRYGYPLLDELALKTPEPNTKPIVLVAPSWFDGCIFDVCIKELIEQLAKLPYTILIRSHPEYEKRNKKSFRDIEKLISAYPGIEIDRNPDIVDRLPTADILITDRSGIAIEYAVGTGRPVLFIETALKQTNPDWKELGIEPIENKLRPELGIVVLPAELEQLTAKIDELQAMKTGFAEKMKELKKNVFYNSASSYEQGLAFVQKKITSY